MFFLVVSASLKGHEAGGKKREKSNRNKFFLLTPPSKNGSLKKDTEYELEETGVVKGT